MTSDLLLGLVRTEELDDMNQLMVVQMKNRYSDPSVNKRFTVGLNRPKMKLYDLEEMSNSSFKPDARNKTYAPKRQDELTDEETIPADSVIESLPMAMKPGKSINTTGFAF
jgi:hypothetical protein